MNPATPIYVADGVAAAINAAVDAEALGVNEFTARRSYADWDTNFEDLSDVAVDVVFQSQGTVNLHSRGYIQQRPTIHVAVRNRFEPADQDANTGRLLNSAVDPYVTLLEEIYLLFATARNTIPLDEAIEAVWQPDQDVIRWVSQQKLRKGLFEGYVEIKFSVREVG